MVDTIDRIQVMLRQEASSYETRDYLSTDRQQQLSLEAPSDQTFTCANSAGGSSHSSGGINESWREKICEWSYQVIDHFDFSREVVMVSMNFLDRYLAARPVNKKVFQLAAMTCLFLAIKLNEPGKHSMASMIKLSRGYFRVDQMAAMEVSILRALKWCVHPPTSYCLVRYMLQLLPYSSITLDARHDAQELARFLSELSVMDYFFVTQRPSTVALAALLNAMEEVPSVPMTCQSRLLAEIRRHTSMNPTTLDLARCRSRLRYHYIQGGYGRPFSALPENRVDALSPVCVSYGVTRDNSHAFAAAAGSSQEENLPTTCARHAM